MKREVNRKLSDWIAKTPDINAIQNPLDFMAEEHMREREVCAMIDHIASKRYPFQMQHQTSGFAWPLTRIPELMDAQDALSTRPDKAIREHVIAFLMEDLPQHLADDEIDLFPMMLERCEAEDEIQRVIDKLQADHKHALKDALHIISLLEDGKALDVGFSNAASERMTGFSKHARRHLILENAIILRLARARLNTKDLEIMREHMMERRGFNPSQEPQKC